MSERGDRDDRWEADADIGERVEDGRAPPRARAVAHMRQLMAAATVLGAANAALACGTKTKDAGDGGDGGNPIDAARDDVDATDASANAPLDAADAMAVAESTLDATTFAGPDAAKKRAEAGASRPTGGGYRVVDPLPNPTRRPHNPHCDPPYIVDPQTGHRKYKVDCIE